MVMMNQETKMTVRTTASRQTTAMKKRILTLTSTTRPSHNKNTLNLLRIYIAQNQIGGLGQGQSV